MKNLLEIQSLTVAFENKDGRIVAVKGAELELAPKETLALVGESGCGKTVLCKTMLKILCSRGKVESGDILLEGTSLIPLTEKEMAKYRGGDIAMVFQDPMTSLNPTMSIGKQIMEPAQLHKDMSKGEAKSKAIELLEMVGIDNPEKRFTQRPHQLSGGQRQRIAIAIALAGEPKLLLADEPTTALDMDTQNQILALLKNLQKNTGIAIIFITHDLSLVEGFADRVMVMKDGEIVEAGSVNSIFAAPKHPYTKKLLGYADYGKGRGHNHGHEGGNPPEDYSENHVTKNNVVVARNLSKYFKLDKNHSICAFKNLNMQVFRGEILGLVGPSGCGKSTLARCIMGIETATEGELVVRENAKHMIFQDSTSAFNPRRTMGEIIAEPLFIRDKKILRDKGLTGKDLSSNRIYRDLVMEMMEQAELSIEIIDRHPYDVSGGQRQRAAIARALILEPKFIIADEPIASLDVSVQAQIIHLFKKIQKERDLTILLISHDLPMVQHVSDRIIGLI